MSTTQTPATSQRAATAEAVAKGAQKFTRPEPPKAQQTKNLREAKLEQAAAKKTPAKQATKTARVAPVARGDRKLPKPATLDWTTKTMRGIEYQVAEGARHLYRVHQSEDGNWLAAQKLKAGSWTPMAGACTTLEEAQQLARWNEAGALWLAYRDVVGLEFAKLVEQYGG